MTDQLLLPDPLVISDGVAAYYRVLSLRKQYLSLLTAAEGPPTAEERRLLLGYVKRMQDSLETADLFAQLSQELIEQVKGSDLSQQLQDTLKSVPDAVKSELSGRDLVAVGIEGLSAVREILADERDKLPNDLASLEAGKRPKRSSSPANISADAEFGGGLTLIAAGAGIATAVALAPVTAAATVAAAPVILAGAAGFAIGAGTGLVLDSVGLNPFN